VPQSKPHTHAATRLRYTYQTSVRLSRGEAQRIELSDYPGHIDRRRLDAYKDEFQAVCDECSGTGFHSSFDAAMKFLERHVHKHACETANASAPHYEMNHVGFTLYSDGLSPRWRAKCTHAGCTWSSNYETRTRAESMGSAHFQSHLDRPTPARPKEPTMRNIATVDRELELAQQRLEKLIAEREKLAKLPTEPENRYKLIAFSIQFQEGDTVYDYAARKARGLWWVTGREGGLGRSWEQMLEFMSQDARVQSGQPIVFRKFRLSDGALVAEES
jgi:exonuclease VII small subunit